MVIVDASVAYKWWDEKESQSKEAKIILDDHLENKNRILAPTLLLHELANAWATKSKVTASKVKSNILDLESVGLIWEEATFKLINKSAVFSRKYRVSVYDAVYAVLAQDKGCDLITADAKFADQVNLPFVKKLG